MEPYVREHNLQSEMRMCMLLDSLRAHWVATVKERHDELGFAMEKVPGGMTYLNQPINVGIAKPFKCGIRAKWRDYMMSCCEGGSATFKKPSRELVAHWVSSVWNNMSLDIIRSSWRHRPYNLVPMPDV